MKAVKLIDAASNVHQRCIEAVIAHHQSAETGLTSQQTDVSLQPSALTTTVDGPTRILRHKVVSSQYHAGPRRICCAICSV